MRLAPPVIAAKIEDEARSGHWSPKMCSLLGCAFGMDFGVEPAVAELTITSDGHLLARLEGDVGCNEFIGSASDWERNLGAFLADAGLDDDEVATALVVHSMHVTDWR